MEMEFRDTSKRRKGLILVGVLLALGAGGGAFMMMSQAQQAPPEVKTRTIIVAARDIPAKTSIEASDLTQRTVPDDTWSAIAMTDPAQVVGRLTGVAILFQQPITPNLLASSTAGAQFSILSPTETLAPDAPLLRAVSVDVPDERAVGGQVQVGQHVDVFVTAQVNVVLPTPAPGAGGPVATPPPASPAPGASPNPDDPNVPYYTDKSTKVTWQNVPVLAKNGTMYILKVDEHQAEEISHLQASGNSMFSLALRPDGDHRAFEAVDYGETTNQIIEDYGMPIPEIYPAPGSRAVPVK
jgi:Flp pilus assembly protein CpaB